MAQSTVIYLTDDIDGTDAEETIRFALDGKTYEIDLNKKNAAALRRALKLYIDNGRSAGRQSTGTRRRGSAGSTTLYSQLTVDERARFRSWAKLPTARRIGDSRVHEWIEAGRP